MSKANPIADVAVAGGGVVGAAAVLALARRLGNEATLLHFDNRESPRGVDRAYAVAPDVRDILEALGVWGGLAGNAQPVSAMTITDSRSGDPVRQEYLRLGDGAGPVAHVVSEKALAEALDKAITGCAGVRRIASSVTGLDAGTAAIEVATAGGTFRARLVAAADGARSRCREIAGIPVIGADYEQAGVVATIGHEDDHDGRAVQHFLPGGPFAMLPLTGRRTSIVWTMPRDEAARVSSLAPSDFLAEIEPIFGYGLGALTVLEGPGSFPLRVQMARRFAGERLVLIGDAAHVVHPLAGQGMNLGLRDADALAASVADAMRLGLDPGAPDVLNAYQQRRRPSAVAMAAVTDGMNRLFSNDSSILRLVRDLGLGIVDRIPAAKRAILAGAAR